MGKEPGSYRIALVSCLLAADTAPTCSAAASLGNTSHLSERAA